jgi:heme iron utilization protein
MAAERTGLGYTTSYSKSLGPVTDVSSASEHPSISAAREAAALITRAFTAALGTIEQDGAGPYVSLVSVASVDNYVPILLLSDLAQHTRNLTADHRASLLFTETVGPTIPTSNPSVDPLARGRVTLIGRLVPERGETKTRQAFLDRHPGAVAYVDFADFKFYRLEFASAHFIGGFGRIVRLSRSDIVGA